MMLEMEEAPGGADESQNNNNSILPLTSQSKSHHSQQLSHQSSHHSHRSHQSNPASAEDNDAVHVHPLDLPAAISTQPSEEQMLMMPLMTAPPAGNVSSEEPENSSIRSRTKLTKDGETKDSKSTRRRRKRKRQPPVHYCAAYCPAPFVRSTLNVMNFLARLLFWGSVVAMVAAVVWYSRELKENGTDPHLIAWFSAGAFVLLGFPISMYGIVMHLANYNQPNIQMYIVRILWMVPIYSMESWLCLRFHRYAIYIETLRDVYESYVLYSFLQFLIEVLGGEEELILMLKDKSPTRGVHMWGLQWCGVKPWLMGQPRAVYVKEKGSRPVKKVQWTSPFFVRCKFGVLQYVLLKFVMSLFVMILELHGLYKEGDFTPRGGYLYICILTNLSQCWALYCLIFFYFATVNELSPIRPVGKFLSVKALVFFTWWQSVCISLIYQMDLIPHYHASNESEWTSEDVAKGLQDYLICIEMFMGSIVHVFVFPHTDYTPQAVQARRQSIHNESYPIRRQLGRRNRPPQPWGSDDFSAASKNSGDVEMAHPDARQHSLPTSPKIDEGDELDNSGGAPAAAAAASASHNNEDQDEDDEDDDDESDIPDDSEYTMSDSETARQPTRTGFVKALIDSTIPRELIDQSVGIVKGDYNVEKKTLLAHAATSDSYDLFSSSRRFLNKTQKQLEGKD